MDALSIEKSGPVTTVILNRPDVKNAVDGPTAARLVEAFLAFEADAEAKVAVFYGAHGAFCAGADLKAIGTDPKRANPMRPIDPALGPGRDPNGPMGPSRLSLKKPVIAAIAGPAVAGGLELALWCDMRVIEEDAVMGVFCRRWGVPLIDGGTVRLPRLIGHSRAVDLILTGRPVSAAEALSFGLANRVVAKGAARQEAENLARQIATFPETCMLNDRRSAIAQWDLDLDAALANEFALGVETLQSGGAAGVQNFIAGKGRGGRFDG